MSSWLGITFEAVGADSPTDLPHALVPLEQKLLETAALENLHPLVRHLCHGRQLYPFQQSLVVRDCHDGALVV